MLPRRISLVSTSTVQELKRQTGKGLLLGGGKLPLALAEPGLIDEYEIIVQPRLAGHGPTSFTGLSKQVDLKRRTHSYFACCSSSVSTCE